MMLQNFLQKWFLIPFMSKKSRPGPGSLLLIPAIFLLQAVFYAAPVYAQPETDMGNWIMYFGSTRLHDKWGLHHEVQYRSYEFPKFNTEQWLLRGGINHHIDNTSMATAGYAFITNHHISTGNKGVTSREHRIWEQFYTRHNVGRVRMEHRYRLEQRWIQANENRYLNRARYFYRLTVPVTNSTLEPNTYFVSLYDEIFLHLNDNPFDRNRLYGALGYQFTKDASVQVGYLLQTIGATTRPYFQYGIFLNIDTRQEN